MDEIINGLQKQNKVLLEVKKNHSAQIEKLKNQLNTNKMFLNMVIHDLRNPTSCVKNGLKQTNIKLTSIL